MLHASIFASRSTWNQPCNGNCSGHGSRACCPPKIVLAIAAVERPATLALSTCLIGLRRAKSLVAPAPRLALNP